MPFRLLTLIFFCAPVLLAGKAQAAQPQIQNTEVALAPHKALYDIKLTSARNGSQIVNIHGKMYYEWKPSCEGWITNHRFTLNYEYADSDPLNISSDFTTFESYDGKSLNFSSRRKKDSETYEDLRGRADLDDAHKGKVVFTLPENLTYDLKSPVFFPTSHTIALLDAARKGSKFLNISVFDGSDDAGPVAINAFIGPKIDARQAFSTNKNIKPASTGHIDQSLLDGQAWNVRMAFFPGETEDSSSDYELSMIFNQNGVISDMKIDYADFSIQQKLVALEKIKPETCQAE